MTVAQPYHFFSVLRNGRFQRLRMYVGLAIGILTVVAGTCPAADERGAERRNVAVRLELSGKLRFNGDGSGVVKQDLKVVGNLRYTDTVVRRDAHLRPRHVARSVEQATGEVQVGKWVSHPKLSSGHRELAAGWYGGRCKTYSRSAPLTQDELDIVALPCDPLVLDLLPPADPKLPAGDPPVGEEWPITDELAAALMRWDVVSKNTLKCSVRRWDAEHRVVLLELSGELLGAVDGAVAEAGLQGKLNYSPQHDRCTWADVRIEEKRAIGHAAPGLDIVARVRVAASPVSPAASVKLAQLQAEVPADPDKTVFYRAFHSARQGFELIHAPDWKLMVDGPTVTIFRLVRDGDLIAQANFSRVHTAERPTLKDYQQQVQAALAGRIERIVAAEQEQREDGSIVFRVTAAGAVESLPIQWMYVYIRNKQGQAVSCALTLDARLAERFAGADEELLSSVRVVDVPESAASSASRQTGSPEPATRR